MFNPYPSGVEEITTDWLNSALHESSHPAAGSVTRCDAKLLDTEGNTGWYALAEIESESGSGLPDTLFFKVATEYGLAITSQYENYSTEIAFYRDVASRSPGQFLQFIYGNADEQTNQGIVVIEAFDPKLTLNTFKGVSVADAELTLTAMGKLHGTWWNRELPASLSANTPDRVFQLIGQVIDRSRPGWATHRESLKQILPHAAFDSVEIVMDDPDRLMSHLAKQPVTITQIDIRAENVAVLERGSQPEAVIFDWQRANLGPAFTDPAYFIGTSVNESDQVDHSSLMVSYFEAVSAGTSNLPSSAEAEQMLAIGSVFALLIRLLSRLRTIEPWIESGFIVQDGDWAMRTIVRTANFVEIMDGASALTSD